MEVYNIDEELKKAKLDTTVGIKHARVVHEQSSGYHVAQIQDHFHAHVHRSGDELYKIEKGEGVMYIGKVTFHGKTPIDVKWEKGKHVKKGDAFIVPEGYAHSLQNIGTAPLEITFFCSDNHLTDDDRFVVENPKYESIIQKSNRVI